MIEMLCGLLGAALGLAFFAAGFWFGRKSAVGKEITSADKYPPSEEELAEQERQRERLRQEQEAFHDLVGYSADVAYGIRAMPGKE